MEKVLVKMENKNWKIKSLAIMMILMIMLISVSFSVSAQSPTPAPTTTSTPTTTPLVSPSGTPSPSPTPCTTASQCNDNNKCTTDSCVGGICQNKEKCTDKCKPCNPSNGNCEPKNCDDGNKCTTDSCDSATGECKHTEKCTDKCKPCNPSNGNCEPKDCNDNNRCTDDSCDSATGNCQYINKPDDTGLLGAPFSTPKMCCNGEETSRDSDEHCGRCGHDCTKTAGRGSCVKHGLGVLPDVDYTCEDCKKSENIYDCEGNFVGNTGCPSGHVCIIGNRCDFYPNYNTDTAFWEWFEGQVLRGVLDPENWLNALFIWRLSCGGSGLLPSLPTNPPNPPGPNPPNPP